MKKFAIVVGCLLLIILGALIYKSQSQQAFNKGLVIKEVTPETTPLPMPEVILDEELTRILPECTFKLSEITKTPETFLTDLQTALENSSCPKYEFFQVILSEYPHDLRFVDIQNLPYMGISYTDLYFDGHFIYQTPHIDVITGVEPIGEHLTFLRYGDANFYGHGYAIVSDEGKITDSNFEPLLSLPYIDDEGLLRYDVMTDDAYGLKDFGKEFYCSKLAPDHSKVYSTSYRATISPEGEVSEPEVTVVTKIADICDS